jgi:hypothetical protein
MSKKNPAVTVAKEQVSSEREQVLSTGYAVRVVPISASLIMEVQNRIPYPPVPIIHDEEKGQTYENPNHPDYIRRCEETDSARTMAAMDAIMMFGVELVDGVPGDDVWLKKLKVMDRSGNIGLSEFDLKDEIDREFLFKKFIAVSTQDFGMIQSMVGVTEEGVESAEDSFPGDS